MSCGEGVSYTTNFSEKQLLEKLRKEIKDK